VHKKFIAAIAGIPAVLALAGTATAQGATNSDGSTVVTFATLKPVVGNHVKGSGWASVKLQGDTATVTVSVDGLIRAPHAMHIHFKGEGECPQASDLTKHDGHLAMSTTNGLDDYGQIGTSLTTSGDTSPASALALARFPHVGTFQYIRVIQLTDAVAAAVRNNNAVVVVHGIDYNHNGKYDYVLGVSDLTPTLPMEATSPALCGPLTR